MRRTPSSASARIVLAMVVVCATLLVAPAVAAAADDGVVSGTVTASSGGPLGTVSVSAYLLDPGAGTWSYWTSAGTAADGTYSIPGLPYGTYALSFVDYTYAHLTECYDDRPGLMDADRLTVGATPLAGIDAVLQRGASISGSVIDAGSLVPIENAYVYPYRYDPATGYWNAVNAGGHMTDASGAFTLTGLPFGKYRFSAQANGFVSEYYLDTIYEDASSVWNLTSDAPASGLDFGLARLGAVAGTVRNLASAPLTGVSARLYSQQRDGNGNLIWNFTGRNAPTNALGAYTIQNVNPGTYRVQFIDENSAAPAYLTEFYAEQANVWAADTITVQPGQTLNNIDGTLSAGGAIAGVVHASGGGGLSSVTVQACAYDPGTNGWKAVGPAAVTDGSGVYTLTGLADDVYHVAFSRTGYDPQYYTGATNVFDGADVPVVNGGSVSGLDATLATAVSRPNGGVTGTVVSDDTGLGIPEVRVIAWRCEPIAFGGGWYWQTSATTDMTGAYSMSLPAGIYRLQITEIALSTYLGEHYDDSATALGGDLVAVTSGAIVTANVGLATGGAITGTVTGEDTGLPVQGVNVGLYREDAGLWHYVSQAGTAADGTYRAGSLAAGRYRVAFSDSCGDYRQEFYSGALSIALSSPVTVTLGSDATGIDASLKRLGRVHGTVTGSDGRPVDGARVRLYRRDPDIWTYYDERTTGPGGTYDFTTLDPAQYTLHVADSGAYGFERYVAEYYDDASRLFDATPIPVGYDQTQIDIALASAGTWGDITGTVTDSVSGDPVGGIAVSRWDPSGGDWVDSGTRAGTAADGTYRLQWVPVGSDYRICADPAISLDGSLPWSDIFARTFHASSPTAAGGEAVAVPGDGTAAGVDVGADPLGSVGYLTGHVAEDGTGADVAGARITLWRYDGSYTEYAHVVTNAGGRFSRPVAAGQYTIKIDDYPAHRAEFYNDVMTDNVADGDLVTVTAALTSDIAASVEPLGSISGRVTAAETGAPITAAYVEAYYRRGGGFEWRTGVSGNADGTYTLDGLAYGDQYIVCLYDNSGAHVSEYYNDQLDIATAHTLTVGPTPLTGIDAALSPSAIIAGTVTDAGTGAKLDGIYVSASRYNNRSLQWENISGDTSDPTGRYTIPTLRAGVYRLSFSGTGRGYANEWYSDVYQLADAADVTVATGATVSGCDAALDRMASLGGEIYDGETGTPIANGWVYAYRHNTPDGTWLQAGQDQTDASGVFTITGLPPGQYAIQYTASGYFPEYRTEAYDPDSATPVTLGAGENLGPFDEPMAAYPGGSISGTVYNAGGTGIANIVACAMRFDALHGVWKQVASDWTDGTGAYSITYLPDATYRIAFRDPYAHYAAEYWLDASTPETALDQHVTGSCDLTFVDATLADYAAPPQGTIAGLVRTDPGASPLAGITVEAARYEAALGGWTVMGTTESGAGGAYSMNVPAGTYRIRFTDPAGHYLGEYYHNGTGDFWSGTNVEVTEGATTTVNEGLEAAARITGTVTADVGGGAVAGAEVNAYRIAEAGGVTWASHASTLADGTYDLGSLTAGDFILRFDDPANVYLGEYYDDAASEQTTTWITLAAAQVAGNVDASLATAGIISGTVTNEATGRAAEQVQVTLYEDDGFGAWERRSEWTDGAGTFRFNGLPNANYYLRFRDTGSPTGYPRFADEFYLDSPDLASATAIPIAHQHATANAALTSTGTWGSIAGTVRDGENGEPLAGVQLVLYEWNGASFVESGKTATSDVHGAYEFGYVAALSGGAPHRVWADASASGYGSAYYSTAHTSALSVDAGDNVLLTGGSYLTGVDVDMLRKPGVSWIGGTITDSDTGTPLAGIALDFYTADWNWVGSATTRADGTYGRPMPAGDYRVGFSDPAGVYAPEWYDEIGNQSGALTIAVSPTGPTTLDESLVVGATISGSVRTSAGDPLPTWVYLYNAAGDYIDAHYADAGMFSFGPLRAGQYRIWFSNTGEYLGEYWDNEALTGDLVTVAAGQTVEEIDGVLNRGGTITGGITSDDGLLAGNVYVYLYRQEPSGWELYTGFWVMESAGWDFTSTPLLPGTWKIEFWDAAGHYDTMRYDGAASLGTATPVTVADEAATAVTLRFDALPPEVGSDAVAMYADSASIEMTATDLVVGVEGITYRLDDGDPVTVETSSVTTSTAILGDHTLDWWAVDRLGHESAHAHAGFTVIDTIAPTVDSDALASYSATATVHITAEDNAGGSGIASLSYRVDGETTQTVAASGANVEIGGVGDHSLEFWAVDNAVNESTHTTVDFTIADITDPTADDDAVATYSGTATIHITADDNVAVDHISYRIDGGGWMHVASNPAIVTVTAVGPHTLQYQAFDASGNSSPVYSAIFTVTRANGVVQTEIAGDNRYETSVRISQEAFPGGSDWVVVATGNNWPDALGGSALAGALDGPILLTNASTLPAAVSAEITRLGADKAIILGGTAAVGTPVETALRTLLGAGDVERLAGTNRYQTADLVGARTIAVLGGDYTGVAFVATGANYPDALGAAPLSAGLKWPLFLTKPTGLDPSTKTAMGGVTRVLVLGGNAVVSPAIESALKATYGTGSVERLAGTNRYATAVAVATYGVAHGLRWNQVAIATGEKFPDALAGGVLQGRDGSVMLLTPTASLNTDVAAALSTHKAVIAEVRYLGGTGAVSQSVRSGVAAALR